MGELTFILGGARSGKSTYAEKLAKQLGKTVTYIATAEPLDDEMAARIQKHKQERPDDWRTLEIPLNLSSHLTSDLIATDIVLLDCLTLLVNNLIMEHTNEDDKLDEDLLRSKGVEEIDALIKFIRKSAAHWIVVSNEVGLGLVPPYALGRVYRDLLGSLNQRIAAAADQVFLMVAGIPMLIHEYRE